MSQFISIKFGYWQLIDQKMLWLCYSCFLSLYPSAQALLYNKHVFARLFILFFTETVFAEAQILETFTVIEVVIPFYFWMILLISYSRNRAYVCMEFWNLTDIDRVYKQDNYVYAILKLYHLCVTGQSHLIRFTS